MISAFGPLLYRVRVRVGRWPRNVKRIVIVAFDAVLLFLCAVLAFKLRLGVHHELSSVQYGLAAVAPIAAFPVFVRLGLYRAVLRYIPERAIWTILQAMLIASLAWVAIIFLTELGGGEGAPRSVPMLYLAIGAFMVAGSRFAIKAILLTSPFSAEDDRRVLVYGAGSAGMQLVSALRAGGDHSILGFVDDNAGLHGHDVAGLRVFPPEHLEVLVERMGVTDVLLCVPTASSQRRLEIAARLRQLPVNLLNLPPISELAAGKYAISALKEIDVEDLLGRMPVPADEALIGSVVTNKTILVTGAGGSIGTELCRLVATHRPARMILVDASEAALFQIGQRLRENRPDFELIKVLASVGNRDRMTEIFHANAVDVVFHAAAFKHVPMLEANALEGIRNNVLGTQVIAEAAYDAGVSTFVLISTDKAVRPISVMGATKRLSELIVGDFAERAEREGAKSRFLSVRFGNVLGSTGSVVPLFKEQIARGGPVTITDPRMTRYFMAIPEAAQLIVQAAGLSEGGEVFLLDMGEPVSILSLAENMIRLAGLSVKTPDNPNGDIAIEEIGMRPGERLVESLFYNPALSLVTRHPKIFKARRRRQNLPSREYELPRLQDAVDAGNERLAKIILFGAISDQDVAPVIGAAS